jgi:hypothetical protein
MITKNKIAINNIIEFIHTAMGKNLDIQVAEYPKGTDYSVSHDDMDIYFYITDEFFSVNGYDKGYLRIPYKLTDRDKIDLQALALDIKEYNEDKAINLFNDFFNFIPQTPASIDNLDDDD